MLRIVAIGIFAASLAAAANIAPFYAGAYTLSDLGALPGAQTPYGGLTFLAGNSNTLLIGTGANGPGGIAQLGLTRDVDGHIIGFSGPATPFASAPLIDGGLAYGPGGVLFFTEYGPNIIGEIKPGGNGAAKTVTAPVPSSVGTLGFVPSGFNGAGNFVVASYSTNTMCVAPLTPDGTGTFNVGACTATVTGASGPEGMVWVPQGSSLFPIQSMLISEYGSARVSSYLIDGNGLPIIASRKDFIQNLSSVEGATLDPVTGDFLFSTFTGSGHLYEVRGFAASAPEPAVEGLIGVGLATLGWFARRRRIPR